MRRLILIATLFCVHGYSQLISNIIEIPVEEKIRNFPFVSDVVSSQLFIYKDVSKSMKYAVWIENEGVKSILKQKAESIYFSKSTVNYDNWEPANKLNVFTGNMNSIDSAIKHPAIIKANDGTLICFWLRNKRIIFNANNYHGTNWYPNEFSLGSFKNIDSQYVCKVKTSGLFQLARDTGSTKFKSRVYICWGDEKHGANNKDVFLSYNQDNEFHFVQPVLITYRPNHKEQFNPSIAVDSKSGIVYVLYYDRQNFLSSNFTDVYLARGKNGGLNFDYLKLNSKPIEISEKKFVGNATRLEINGDTIIAKWFTEFSRNKKLGEQVKLNEKDFDALANHELSKEIKTEKTNSFSDKMEIHFECDTDIILSAAITKPLLPGFEKVIFENKPFTKGKNTIEIVSKKFGIEKGNYILTLYYNNINTYVWIIEE